MTSSRRLLLRFAAGALAAGAVLLAVVVLHRPAQVVVPIPLEALLAVAPADTQLFFRVDLRRRSIEDVLSLAMGKVKGEADQKKLEQLASKCGDNFFKLAEEATVTFGPQLKTTAMLRGQFDTKKLEDCIARFTADFGEREEWEGVTLYAGDRTRKTAVIPGAVLFGDAERIKAQIQLLRGVSTVGAMSSHPQLSPHLAMEVSAPVVAVLIPSEDIKRSALNMAFHPALEMNAVVATGDLEDDLLKVSINAVAPSSRKADEFGSVFLPAPQHVPLKDLVAPTGPEVRVGVTDDVLRVEARVAPSLLASAYQKFFAARGTGKN
jgi:hypothetical protein